MDMKFLKTLAVACLAMLPPNGLADDLPAGFENPLDACKPHTWWHWMNGHVTREAITRDLEDMKRIGFGGFTLWNTHEGIPKGPVKYASEKWWEYARTSEHYVDAVHVHLVDTYAPLN